jgi:hypothetical protein
MANNRRSYWPSATSAEGIEFERGCTCEASPEHLELNILEPGAFVATGAADAYSSYRVRSLAIKRQKSHTVLCPGQLVQKIVGLLFSVTHHLSYE